MNSASFKKKQSLNLFMLKKLIEKHLGIWFVINSTLSVGQDSMHDTKAFSKPAFAKSQFNGGSFINRRLAEEQHGLFEYLKMRWEDEFSPWPNEIPLVPKKIPAADSQGSCCQLTFVGHSTTIVRIGHLVLVTDPILSERASPVTFLGPKRVRKPGVDFKDWPKIDYVLISHNHYDHLDIPTLKLIQERDKPTYLVGLGNKKLLESVGITAVNEMDWGERIILSGGEEVTYLECQHFSGRGLFDRNQTLWGSFLINAGGKKVYFAGDTGYSNHFAEQGMALAGIDLAVLPIGAYLPRWFMKPMHVDPAEAVRAHIDLKAKKSLGIHFGTFQLTSESVDDPLKELEQARVKFGISKSEFIVPEFGDTYPF